MNYFERERIIAEAKFNEMMTEDFIPLNIWTVRLLGTDVAVMFAKLYEEYNYKKHNGGLGNEMFSCSVLKVKNDTGLSAAKQNRAIATLKNNNLIEKVTTGLPKKRFFKLNILGAIELSENMIECKITQAESKSKRIAAYEELKQRLQNQNSQIAV